jgi:hypothetical protein
MGLVREELDRIALALRSRPERYAHLYAAQQALVWTIDPEGFAPPMRVVEAGLADVPTDTLAMPEGCPAEAHQPSS